MNADHWFLHAGLKGLVLAFVGMLLVLMMRKSSAARRHLVSTLAVVGLIGVPVLTLWSPRWEVELPVPEAWVSPAEATEVRPLLAPDRGEVVAGPERSMTEVGLGDHLATPPRKGANAWEIAFAVWLIGVLIALSPMVIGVGQLARLHHLARPVSDPLWLAVAGEVAGRLGIRRRVRLIGSGKMLMPATWGILRPAVLVPDGALAWPEPRRRVVLLHEMAHVKRFDWLTQMIGRLACALHWFNPMAWWLLRRMEVDREQACDDLVLEAGTKPSDYADELVEMAKGLKERSLRTWAAVPMARRSNLEARVLGVLDRSRKRKAITIVTALVAVAACVLIVAPLASMRTRLASSKEAVSERSSILDSVRGVLSEGKDVSMKTPVYDPAFSLTPSGICEAARSGDLELIKKILTEKPELLVAKNPANWANLPGMKVHPWASRPVEIAVVFGHADVVAYLLSLSGTEEDPIGGYYEAFAIALRSENQPVIRAITNDVVRRVTERPELVNYARKNGSTYLHFASSHGHLGLMEQLLSRGADPTAATDKGVRPIHHVAGDNAETKLLLQHGIPYDLWVAAAAGDLTRARQILAKEPGQVAVDYKPFSVHSDGLPLVIAATHGYTDMVKLLLEHGADVNGRLEGREFADDGLSLLDAFANGHYDVVNLLLDHGADTDAWVDADHNFKYRVKESDHQQIKDRVLTPEEQNPPIKSPSFVAWTGELHGDIRQLPAPTPEDALGVISAAIVSHNRHHDYANYKEIIAVMLEQGANQNAWMKQVTEEEKAAALKKRYWHREYGTPLHWLATAYLNKANYSPNPDIPTREELVDLAGLFVDFGANLEARHPISNHTPLSSAVEEGITEYVQYLLKQGAQVNRTDPPETNPIEIANRLGFKEIADLLNN